MRPRPCGRRRILLDRDVTGCPVSDISGAQVRLTMVGGRIVHDADSPAGRAAAGRVAQAARRAPAGTDPAAQQSRHQDACGH